MPNAAGFHRGDPIRYTDIATGDVVHTTITSIEYGYIGVWDENAERGDWLHPDEVEHDGPTADDGGAWMMAVAERAEAEAVAYGFELEGGF